MRNLYTYIYSNYKLFMKKNNGVSVDNKYICSYKVNFCSEKKDILQGLFCIDHSINYYDLNNFIDFYFDEITSKGRFKMIPIGLSVFGTVILIKNNGKIVSGDFQNIFKSSFPFKNTYYLSASFSDFINSLCFEKINE